MYKNLIITFLVLAALKPDIYSQENSSRDLWTNTKIGLSGTYDLFNKSVGFIAKGEKEIIRLNHFEAYTGLAFQFSRQNEKGLYMESGLEGGSNDIGFYGIVKLNYYPFKRKTLFIGLEPFLGLTNFKSEGTLELLEYDISETYSNSYTYFNYGLTPAIGYTFKRFETSIFSMISLKGVLDSGRNRWGDADSRILFGVNFSYKLNPVD